jgi:hypothetical protein
MIELDDFGRGFEYYRELAISFRNGCRDTSSENALELAHECELIADALEAGQRDPSLRGYGYSLVASY